MDQKVVITGVGVVAPNGVGREAFWSALSRGHSGIGPITLFDASGLDCRIAGEVDLECEGSRPHHFALLAAREALQQSGVLDTGTAPPSRRAAVLGGGCVDLLNDILISSIVRANPEAAGSPEALDLDAIADDLPNNPFLDRYADFAMATLAPRLAQLCEAWQSWTLSTACAGGAQAIHDGYRAVRHGRVDWALAGGVDSLITRQMMSGFCQLTALSTCNDEPERASRPFDRDRDGFVMGEGGAFLLLESQAHAQERGATILSEMAGAGISSDAWRLTDPREDAVGMVLSMERALGDASAGADDIDYINAHGTSTQANDRAESVAIHRLLGDRASRVPVSSTKGMTGHLVHGAGAVEAAACVLSIQEEAVPPTINFETPDPECNLDVVPNEARQCAVDLALSNSFGFGGQNTTLAFRRWTDASQALS